MEKNGNTLAPGDDVVLRGTTGKTASARGKVIDVDSSVSMVRVEWPDTTGWVEFDKLERA